MSLPEKTVLPEVPDENVCLDDPRYFFQQTSSRFQNEVTINGIKHCTVDFKMK